MLKKVNEKKLITNKVLTDNLNFTKNNLTLNCFIVGKTGESWTSHSKDFIKLSEDQN